MNESLEPTLPVSAPAIDEERPWPGLAHYAEADHRYFFGREEQVDLLARSTRRTALTVLYGTSGRGKSSIIGAGLIHHLKLAGHGVTLLRRDYDTLSEEPLVARVIRLACADHHLGDLNIPARDQTLWQFFHDRSRPWCAKLDGSRVLDLSPVLIFDQFEEIFSKGEDHPTDRRARAWARKFLKQLANLVENRPPASLSRRLKRCKGEERQALLDRYDFESQPVRVVLVLRADYLARLERLRAVMPSLMQQRIELPDLTGEQALAAAFRPGTLRPEKPPIISEEIAAQIVRCAANVADSTPLKDITSVPASILNLLCNELNEGRGEAQNQKPCVTEFTSRAADGIMRAFYEKRMARHHRVRPVLERLLAPNGNREAPLVQTVLAELARVPDARKQILEDLPNERILVVERNGRAERIEFTHDKLAEFAKNSADARAASARYRRNFFWTAAAAVVIAGIALWTNVQQQQTAKAREIAENLGKTLDDQRKVVLKELFSFGANLGAAPTWMEQYEDVYRVLDNVRDGLSRTDGQKVELQKLEGVIHLGRAQIAFSTKTEEHREEAKEYYRKAEAIWEILSKEMPGDADVQKRLGASRYGLAIMIGDDDPKRASEIYALAAASYHEASRIDPSNADTRLWQAQSLRSQTIKLTKSGEYDKAAEVIDLTAKLLSEMLVELEQGKFASRVTKSDPGTGLAWRRMLGEIEWYRGLISAEKFYKRLPQSTPAEPNRDLTKHRADLLPYIEEAERHIKGSISELNTLQQENPDNLEISEAIGMQYFTLGALYAQLDWASDGGKRKDAAIYLDAAVSQLTKTTKYDDRWSAANSGADLWRKLGDLPKAAKAVESAILTASVATNASDSTDPKIWEWIGNWTYGYEFAASLQEEAKNYTMAANYWQYGLAMWENYYLSRADVTDGNLERAIQCATALAHAQRRQDSFDLAAAEASLKKAAEFAGRIKSEQKRNQWVATCQARLEQASLLRELSDSVNFAATALNNGPQDPSAQQHTAKARELLTDLQAKLATTPDNATAIWVLPFEAALLNLEGTALVHSNDLSGGEEKFTKGLAIFKELGAETPLVFTNFAQNFHTKLDWVKTLKAEAATQKP